MSSSTAHEGTGCWAPLSGTQALWVRAAPPQWPPLQTQEEHRAAMGPLALRWAGTGCQMPPHTHTYSRLSPPPICYSQLMRARQEGTAHRPLSAQPSDTAQPPGGASRASHGPAWLDPPWPYAVRARVMPQGPRLAPGLSSPVVQGKAALWATLQSYGAMGGEGLAGPPRAALDSTPEGQMLCAEGPWGGSGWLGQ